ncbi:MAG: hydantoinase/oxoprolinase family protein [Clostridiales bacterium]|jgi:N-methylhydantoinase A/oxoprolinase/acetone carboxylase beta subunit|nr:hydantoinase/oxoprolinase family protein [Clostridiales bacterium]
MNDNLTKRSVRVGIDVGGTHTKAVCLDNDTHQILGKSSVKTTHDHKDGVAAGVVQCFINCLNENSIDSSEVVFVAHSTTQATNALVEGDVAKVGVIGLGTGVVESFLVKVQTNIKNIELGMGKRIETISTCVNIKKAIKNPEILQSAVKTMMYKGAQVIVASKAFGVDNPDYELKVQQLAQSQNLLCTMASEITKLYGLVRRTKTAIINGSILPKMIDTATSTESSIRAANVDVPLMIMRGDGGVMEITEMKKRPVLTMLSGPAASVMGSLMYLRASNGIYFEVGGTTTNIGVIKNGRPSIDYSQVGRHKTFISSLDVKVLGCAGGSMVRANKNGIVDVGPRSAHIAGLDYCVYTNAKEIVSPQIEFFSPRKGDPNDYVAIKLASGKRLAITNSCAANVLGLIDQEHFSKGDVEAATLALQALADYCNTTVETIATQIMECSYAKIMPVVMHFIEKYKLDREQISMVGVGGGASSLIVYIAKKMGLSFSIPENAEVISSIGVALAMVRDVVERVIPSPTKNDLNAIKQEAKNKAIESGATADSVEVHIDIDPQTFKVTAIATGSTEVKTSSVLNELDEQGARQLVAMDFKVDLQQVSLVEQTKYFYFYQRQNKDLNALRVVDKKGFIRVQSSNAYLVKSSSYVTTVRRLWEDMAKYQSEVILRPDFYICAGARLMDFSSIDLDQLLLLMESQLSDFCSNEEIIVIATNRA